MANARLLLPAYTFRVVHPIGEFDSCSICAAMAWCSQNPFLIAK